MNDAYTAGIIDADGSIGIFCQDGYYHARAKVDMTDKGLPVLNRLSREYGGKLHGPTARPGNARDVYSWRRDGAQAIRFIKRIYPHLTIKRGAAEIALQLHDLVSAAPKRPNGKAIWCDELRARAEILKRRINEFNARGKCEPFEPAYEPGREPFAVLRHGEWTQPDFDLFGPVRFDETMPASGSMRGGVLYEA